MSQNEPGGPRGRAGVIPHAHAPGIQLGGMSLRTPMRRDQRNIAHAIVLTKPELIPERETKRMQLRRSAQPGGPRSWQEGPAKHGPDPGIEIISQAAPSAGRRLARRPARLGCRLPRLPSANRNRSPLVSHSPPTSTSRAPADDGALSGLPRSCARRGAEGQQSLRRTSDGAPRASAAHSWRLADRREIVASATRWGDHDRLAATGTVHRARSRRQALSGDTARDRDQRPRRRPRGHASAPILVTNSSAARPGRARARAQPPFGPTRSTSGARPARRCLAKAHDKNRRPMPPDFQGANRPDFEPRLQSGYARAQHPDAHPVTPRPSGAQESGMPGDPRALGAGPYHKRRPPAAP